MSVRSGGLILFIVANFAYQAALIYYDATLKTVSLPATRGNAVRDRRGGRVHAARSSSGLAIFLLDVPVEDRFRLVVGDVRLLRDPDLRLRQGADGDRARS